MTPGNIPNRVPHMDNVPVHVPAPLPKWTPEQSSLVKECAAGRKAIRRLHQR